MNFGKWIVVSFVLFALFIGTLVTICVKQDISLVSKDYYGEELIYQQQIKRIANTRELRDKPLIRKVGAHSVGVDFGVGNEIASGKLKLFCPSNSRMDKEFELDPSKQQTQLFDTEALASGMYRARLFWTMKGKDYYLEEIIYL